jgi:hypothetical protein
MSEYVITSDDHEPDPQAARRRHRALIDAIDREIADERDPAVLEERRLEAERRAKWRNMPPVRLRPGVPTHRLTEQEAAYMDRSGY